MSLENFMLAETSQMQTKQMWNDSTFMRQLEKPFKRQKRTRQLSKSCWMMVWHLSLSFYLSFSLSLSFFFFLRARREKQGLPSAGSRFRSTPWPRLSYMARSKLHAGSSIRISHIADQKLSTLSHHCCLLAFALAGSWSQEPLLIVKPRCTNTGQGLSWGS